MHAICRGVGFSRGVQVVLIMEGAAESIDIS
jgi:hypothetical protein